MSNKLTIEAFQQLAAQWADKSIKYIWRRKYLTDEDRKLALVSLFKYQKLVTEPFTTVMVGLDEVEYRHQLSGLIYQQTQMNKEALLYEYPPYIFPDGKYRVTDFSICVDATTDSMAPQILEGDNLLCVYMTREELVNYKGVAALVYRKDSKTPRIWNVGRVESIGGRLIRLTNDNKQFGRFDMAHLLRNITLSFKVVSLDRKLDHEHRH